MAKATWVFSVFMSAVAAIYAFLYLQTGYMVPWIGFCALALFVGQDGDLKKFPHFLLSMCCGVIWGWLNLRFTDFCLGLGLTFPQAVALDVLILTTLAMGTHLVILRNTLFNNMPFVFMGIALSFSGTPSLQIAAALTCGQVVGLLCALGAGPIFAKLSGPAPEPEDKSSESTS
jgi:hypothetical protein